MPDKVAPGPVCEERSIREAVCIHTKKIFDSCKEEDIASYKMNQAFKLMLNAWFASSYFCGLFS